MDTFENPVDDAAFSQRPQEVLLLETSEHDGVQEIFSEAELFEMLRPMSPQGEPKPLTIEEEALAVFDMMDTDRNRDLDEQELGEAIAKALGEPLAPEALEALFRRVDTDQNKAISTTEFVVWWTKQTERLGPHQDAATHLVMMLSASAMINPHSTFRRNWDVIQLILLVYVATIVPWRICFSRDVALWSSMFFFELFIDLFFIVDIMLNFRTAVITSNGDVLVDAKVVAKNYLRSWFFLDLLSCMPFGYVQYFQDPDTSTNSAQASVRLLRVLRLVKLLRLTRVIQVRTPARFVRKIIQDRQGIVVGLFCLSATFTTCSCCSIVSVCRHLRDGPKRSMHL